MLFVFWHNKHKSMKERKKKRNGQQPNRGWSHRRRATPTQELADLLCVCLWCVVCVCAIIPSIVGNSLRLSANAAAHQNRRGSMGHTRRESVGPAHDFYFVHTMYT